MMEPGSDAVARLVTLGLEDEPATPYQRHGALALCAILALATLFAALFGYGPGPFNVVFIPVAATIWSFANLLTAFLLLAQFYIDGSIIRGVAAAAYALTGFLSWSYLAAFPGVLETTALATHHLPFYLWIVWHCTFPILIVCGARGDAALGRIVSRAKIRLATGLLAAGPLVLACIVTVALYRSNDALPALVVGGHFQAIFSFAFAPAIFALNIVACAMLLWNPSRVTPLKLCLAIALFSASLDTFLNGHAALYSYAWGAGKLITVVTSSVVLIMILCDLGGVYGRITRIAKIDALTSLANRRAFEEHFELVFRNARRLHKGMALLIIDVDFFKRFNDTHGHLAGDECLRLIAGAIAACVTRPLDLVARYGGEEFVVVLPDTSLAGVVILAERIRSGVEELPVVFAGKAARVTVSIGIAFAPDARRVDATTLFEAADRGLYDAKDRGRNRVVLGSTQTAAWLPDHIRAVLSAADQPVPGATVG